MQPWEQCILLANANLPSIFLCDCKSFCYLQLLSPAGNGHIGHCNQGNNMYLFPGLVSNSTLLHVNLSHLFILYNLTICSCSVGLGTLLSGSRIISDGMLQAAAEWYCHLLLKRQLLSDGHFHKC